MTAVVEPKKKHKKDDVTLDDGVATEELATESTPAPDPKPGEPGFDWAKQYPGESVFVYLTPEDQETTDGDPCGDVEIGLAAISEKRQPSIGFLRDSRRKPEFEQTLDMLELVASDDALSLVDSWKPGDLIVMWNKWTDWNKTNAGK